MAPQHHTLPSVASGHINVLFRCIHIKNCGRDDNITPAFRVLGLGLALGLAWLLLLLALFVLVSSIVEVHHQSNSSVDQVRRSSPRLEPQVFRAPALIKNHSLIEREPQRWDSDNDEETPKRDCQQKAWLADQAEHD
jgi:hypothetical protein